MPEAFISDSYISIKLMLSKPKNHQDADKWYVGPGWYLRAYSNEGHNQVDPPEYPVGYRRLTANEIEGIATVLGMAGNLMVAGQRLARSTKTKRLGFLEDVIKSAEKELRRLRQTDI